MKWPTAYTTPSSLARHCRAVLRSCARHSSLDSGQKLHAAAITAGLLTHPSLYLRNVIMHMYAACGYISHARKLFDEIPLTHKDTADWTMLMDCHSRAGSCSDALNLFVVMKRYGVLIDDITIISVLSNCAKLGNSVFGVQGHACMIKSGLDYCVKARNAAMDMYVKCGLIGDAKTLFDEMNVRNVVSWTVLLWGVIKWEGLEKGQNVFDEMPEKNEIAWTILISRYVENGFIKEAFSLLTEMMFGFGLRLNSSSLCSLLSACTQSGDIVMGKWAHSYALKATPYNTDVKLGTSLLDMYAKCGRINNAVKVFNSMTTRNVITWNAMLGGLAMHGKGTMVLNMFDKMSDEIKPNDITFTAVLSACSHSGLVETGRNIFHALENNAYGLKPSMENYACVVDLLARSGHLQEAEDIIRRMPMRPNEVVLGSLLGACNAHKQHEIRDRVVQDLARMYPNNTDHHILLSNMYALSGKPDKASSLRHNLRDRGIRKVPGISTMYINGQVHRFSAGDKSHPQINEIYHMLDEMILKLKTSGYVPDFTSQILSGSMDDDMNVQEEKERALLSHSEKLAVCFGLISTKPGTPLYIFKNLRICRDCHSAMKIVSKVYDREIVIRDRNRFHSFKDGFCSCFDFW